jgi:tetratricopeptide (TPR) repeat protein
MYFYAGETDNVVTSVSALDVFPPTNTAVIRGDHSSIIQPESARDDAVLALRMHMDQVIESSEMLADHHASPRSSDLPTDEALDVQELLDRAAAYEAQGLNAQAKAMYVQAISSDNIDALQEYSRFQRRHGDLVGSISTSSRVIEILVDGDDTVENFVRRCHVMSTTGISQRKLGRLQQSEKSLREAVSAAPGDTAAEMKARAYALDNLGITLMRGTDMSAARRFFKQALTVREALDDEPGLAQTLMNIARLEQREGGLDAAAEACDKVLALLDKDEDKAAVASALSIRGEVAYARPDVNAAQDAFTEALELNTATGRSVNIALSQQQLARTLLMKGDTVAAETYARKSLDNYESASNVEGEVSSRQLLGRIANANGDLQEAALILEECVTTYRRLGNLTGEAWSSFYLAEVLYLLDRPEAAAARLRRADALADSINNASLRRAVDTFSVAKS